MAEAIQSATIKQPAPKTGKAPGQHDDATEGTATNQVNRGTTSTGTGDTGIAATKGEQAKGRAAQGDTPDHWPAPGDQPTTTIAVPTKPDTAARDPNRGTNPPPPPPPPPPGGGPPGRRRRRGGPQWWLRNVRKSDVAASKRGYQVYVLKDAYGKVLYVGKSGGAGGLDPMNWENRVRAHVNDPSKKEWIGEVDRISVTCELNEMEAFALEEHLIHATSATNKNISPGEFTTRFPEADLAKNSETASRRATFNFETDIVP